MTEALDNAEASLAQAGEMSGVIDASWAVRRLVQHDAALRALAAEHRRVLAELDEAHAHFQVQEARIRALSGVADDRIERAIDVLSWSPDHDGGDACRVQQDYMHRAQLADEALAILTGKKA